MFPMTTQACACVSASPRIDVLIPKIPLFVYELYRVRHMRVTRRGTQAVPTIGVNPKLDNIAFTNRSALVVYETCEFSHLTKKKRGSPATLKVFNFAAL
jgi:hypothetical protein